MASPRERGSIIIYILIAIFLTGVLVASMTQGAKKSASSERINEMMLFLQSDIQTLQNNVTECVTGYSGATSGVTNPNTPFPMYCANSTCLAGGLTSGVGGVDISLIGCPGAPDGQRVTFSHNVNNNFKLLGDSANFNVKFFTDATEGVYFRVTRAVTDSLWAETLTRLNTKYSACAAAYVTANPDPLGFDCSGGCFYYWILRRSTSSSSFEASCP